MNLLIITNLFPNPLEPLRSTFNEQQILALAGMMRIHVISPVSWLRKLRYRLSGTLGRLDSCTEWRGIEARYPTYYYLPRVMSWFRGFTMAGSILPACRYAVRHLAPHAILTTWAFPDGFAAVMLGRLFKLPVIIKVHGTDVEMLEHKGVRRRLTLWAFNRSARVISVSRYLRDKLLQHGVPSEKIVVVYNGVDDSIFAPRDAMAARGALKLAADRRVMVFVGNLKHDKGLLDLFTALTPDLCARHLVSVYVIGDGPLRGKLEALIRDRSLDSCVHLLGRRTPDEIAQWMNGADFLCLPSHHEGLPNVILEALSCGLPVLATRVGGIPEVVNAQNGMLVTPQRPDELGRAMETMLSRQWDRSAVRHSCPAASWNESAAALSREISACLG